MYAFLKVFFLSVVIFISTFLQGQNIVPNGNLEDVNICTELHAPCSPSAWFTVRKSIPGGYYHVYPDHAASGKQYFDLNVANAGKSRQYWETMLLCKLVPGEKYEVSIKIAGGEPGPNVNDIGLYFTSNFIFSKNDTLLQPHDYLNFLDATISRLKNNWFLLKKEFTAAADATCLVIGNFSSEDNTSIITKRGSRYNLVNMMVDDIVVNPLHAASCSGYQRNKDSLYAIKERHSNDTLISKNYSIDTVKNEKIAVTLFPEQTKKTDTLQLSNVLFEFDRYKLLNPDTLETFRAMLSNPAIKRIQVVGYTDDAGSEAYNKNLSEKRAKEIARLVVSKFGIATAIIQAEGKGISTSHTDKSLNRRVDIYIYY